jgi:transketolase
MATRNLVGDLLQQIAQNNASLMMGSADLFSSTLAVYKNGLPFDNTNYGGQNIYYGVREFAMCAINNGIVAHGGLKAIGSTFLSFSDYAKPAIRLAAISHIPTINIFSHDTLTVGEDGPTHQPIEQISSLRLIPNHELFRPCNKAESIVALEYAITSKNKPVTIITSRGVFNQYDSNIDDARKGGYIFRSENNHNINIITCGSEIDTAIKVSDLLKEKGIIAKVISMLNTNLFDQQDEQYKQSVIDYKPTVSIEFGSTAPWHKYASLCIGINVFGKSGKPKDVLQHFNLTPPQISIKIED